jgi:hypothetical protein
MPNIEIIICWDGSLSTLTETIQDELSRVTEGKYRHGKVAKTSAHTYICGDGKLPIRYHRKFIIAVDD